MEERDFQKMAYLALGVSVMFLLVHFYWYCHSIFLHHDLSFTPLNQILVKLSKNTALFSRSAVSKGICALFVVLSGLGVRGRKDEKINKTMIVISLVTGFVLLFFNHWLLSIPDKQFALIYIIVCAIGYLVFLWGVVCMSRLLKTNLMKDVFNVENESFMQETRLLENPNSINLETEFYYKEKFHKGWINIVNPFRALMVFGSPGSGKSFGVVNPYIKQGIDKGYAQFIYDYKYPDLTYIAYNHFRLNKKSQHNDKEKSPKFYILNFDDMQRTHRCNPIDPKLMDNITDAFESSSAILLNLNKTWVQKQGDFFVESPKNLLAAVIWFLKIYQNGKYCTFPHAVEFICSPYEKTFPILMSYAELRNPMRPFDNAWKAGANDQLQGQVASVQIPLAQIISPSLYWVLSGNNFSLDINNPKEPKILCMGNNPERQNTYNAALGLFLFRLVRIINKPKKRKCMLVLDEFPTLFVKGFDNLVATARSRKVAVLFVAQDPSQINRDYGEKESKVIQNLPGSIISGQVVGEGAKTLQDRFGKILQKRQSISINKNDTSSSISTQMDYMIPAHTIANLSQGFYVGSVADERKQRIKQKIFHAEIKVDIDKLEAEESQYEDVPIITDFTKYKTPKDSDLDISEDDNEDEKSRKMKTLIERVILRNQEKIQKDVEKIIQDETERLLQEGQI